MVQTWLMELANGIGGFFLNPLVYWAIILSIVVGYKRIRKERNHFGLKIFDIFSEWKNAGRVTLIYGIVL